MAELKTMNDGIEPIGFEFVPPYPPIAVSALNAHDGDVSAAIEWLKRTDVTVIAREIPDFDEEDVMFDMDEDEEGYDKTMTPTYIKERAIDALTKGPKSFASLVTMPLRNLPEVVK